jgi:citrate synthase
MEPKQRPSAGLEGVVLTSTKLSRIDGIAGQLSYAGYDIEGLAQQASFEEVCWLLWHGELPTAQELASFRERLAAERHLSADELGLVDATPLTGHGMDALRTLASALAQLDPQAEELSLEAAERVGLRLLGKLPALIAAWERRRHGLEPVAPDDQLSHAANVLLMLRGDAPSEEAARALNTYLVVLAEHGLNASTFAARVVISTQADIYAAIVAAIAALKGLLHGGANQKAMEAFLEIGAPERAQAYIEGLLARRGRLMGIGHRIYRVEDPRVRHLRAQVTALADQSGSHWPEVTDAVGQVVASHPYFAERQLNPNVEFYSAPLLYALGLPLDLFTVAFALSRTAGWIAHIREQVAENRIIRPRADYGGPAPREFTPVDRR